MATDVSKAQQEVWEWKEAAYDSLKDIPQQERVPYILSRVQETVARLEEHHRHSKGKTSA